MKKYQRLLLTGVLAAAMLVSTGCKDKGENQDSNTENGNTAVERIDYQEWESSRILGTESYQISGDMSIILGDRWENLNLEKDEITSSFESFTFSGTQISDSGERSYINGKIYVGSEEDLFDLDSGTVEYDEETGEEILPEVETIDLASYVSQDLAFYDNSSDLQNDDKNGVSLQYGSGSRKIADGKMEYEFIATGMLGEEILFIRVNAYCIESSDPDTLVKNYEELVSNWYKSLTIEQFDGQASAEESSAKLLGSNSVLICQTEDMELVGKELHMAAMNYAGYKQQDAGLVSLILAADYEGNTIYGNADLQIFANQSDYEQALTEAQEIYGGQEESLTGDNLTWTVYKNSEIEDNGTTDNGTTDAGTADAGSSDTETDEEVYIPEYSNGYGTMIAGTQVGDKWILFVMDEQVRSFDGSSIKPAVDHGMEVAEEWISSLTLQAKAQNAD